MLPTYAGPEIGVASTKAFTCQLAALAAFAIAAGEARGTLSRADEKTLCAALLEAPRHIAEFLKQEAYDQDCWARKSPRRATCSIWAAVRAYPLALEGALKLKEISYIHAEGYAAGEMKHGPIALIDEAVPIIVIAPHDAHFEKTISNMQEVMARGGKVLLISDASGIAKAGKVWARSTVPDTDSLHHAADLCHPGAAAGLLRGHRQRHRRGSAAQSGQIGDSRISDCTVTPEPCKVSAMTDQNALKRAVAAKALEYVQDGMKLGLGSGSTAEIFVEMLAPRVRGGEKLLCVPTSRSTAALARKLGITLASVWTIWRRWTSPWTAPTRPTAIST